ncbi:MAG TPA: site-2 protease family protein [Candidatus Doudnabacteria bacterium]|nr:site-2 protease family protein [Candidatus Doudnabacteria bacterium]
MDFSNLLIILPIILFSVIVHEICHGLVAEKLGDSTARDAGRITLNPIPHIDPYGSILLPGILIAVGSPILLGAAKPVPVMFEHLRPRKLGMALVSIAGPASNFLLAILFAIPITLGLVTGFMEKIWTYAVFINLILGTFNLLPIPPLDGSKILASLLPDEIMYRILEFERFGFFLIIILLLLGVLGWVLWPVVDIFFRIFNLNLFLLT